MVKSTTIRCPLSQGKIRTLRDAPLTQNVMQDFSMRSYPPESVLARDSMAPEYQAALIRVLANQARAENAAANTYLTWARRVSDPGTRVRLVELAREEVEHWSGCVELLGELGIAPECVTHHHSPSWFFAAARLATVRTDWVDVATFSFVFEKVGYVMIEDYAQSSYAPHARLSRQILQEEAAHPGVSADFMGGIIASRGPAPIQRALRKWWPFALNAFGPSQASRVGLYIDLGLKVRTNDGRREAFRTACELRLVALGLEAPRLYRNRYPYI